MSDEGNQGGAMNESESVTRESTAEALQEGPRAALIISSVAVGILFAGWLFFYFVLFMSRGHVG
jgi:hypothetical protein